MYFAPLGLPQLAVVTSHLLTHVESIQQLHHSSQVEKVSALKISWEMVFCCCLVSLSPTTTKQPRLLRVSLCTRGWDSLTFRRIPSEQIQTQRLVSFLYFTRSLGALRAPRLLACVPSGRLWALRACLTSSFAQAV